MRRMIESAWKNIQRQLEMDCCFLCPVILLLSGVKWRFFILQDGRNYQHKKESRYIRQNGIHIKCTTLQFLSIYKRKIWYEKSIWMDHSVDNAIRIYYMFRNTLTKSCNTLIIVFIALHVNLSDGRIFFNIKIT